MRLFILILFASIAILFSCSDSEPAFLFPGIQAGGRTLLSNGRFVTPVGLQVPVEGNPVDVELMPDGTAILVLSDVKNSSRMSAVSIQDHTTIDTINLATYSSSISIGPDGRITVGEAAAAGSKTFTFSENKFNEASSRDDQKIVGSTKITSVVTAFSSDRKTIYSSGFTTDSISVIDVESNDVSQVFSTSPFENAPDGTQISALAVSDNGALLAAAHAATNEISLYDISTEPVKQLCRIPAGIRPLDLVFMPGGMQILVANYGDSQQQESGSLSILDIPAEEKYDEYTSLSVENNRYQHSERAMSYGEAYMAPKAIPQKTGETSLIRNVVLIVKGNLSFDMTLGDSGSPFADSTMAVFGKNWTPNLHKLAETFGTFDNYYSPASSRLSGLYSSFSGSLPLVNNSIQISGSIQPEAFLAIPSQFLWEGASEADVSFRAYGIPEYFAQIFPDLNDNTESGSPWNDPSSPDLERAESFINDFNSRLESDIVPQLSIIVLPGGRTDLPGSSMSEVRQRVRESDLATGMIVEAVSSSRIWNQSAVFIIENDSSSGQDHINPHRSLLFAVSPYAKRGYMDHTMYTPASVIRTISLILGISPLNLNVAAAHPLSSTFENQADLTPFQMVQ